MGDLISFRAPDTTDTTDTTEPKYGLSLIFNTDALEFCYGFETGLLFARLEARPERWAGTYHAANEEMIRRVAASVDYIVEIEPLAEGWITAEFFPRIPC